MHRFFRTLPLLVLAGAAAWVAPGFEEARRSITAAEIRAHLYFLSHDNLQGRAPGTRGGQLAAEFIATQFLRMGLEPVGGSHFQGVPLTGTTTDPTTLSLAFESDDQRLTAHYPGDAVIWPGAIVAPGLQVRGELVFVGFGADAPRWGWDDFKGRDLNGKILVFLVGDPPAPPDEPDLFDGRAMTWYGRWTYKLEEARRRGATGALIIHYDQAAGISWDVVRTAWTGERLALARDQEGQLLLNGWLTQDFARRLFATAGLDLDELYVRATRRDFRPVSTGLVVQARMSSRSRNLESRNVVGLLPGSDPERADEVVVITAHYDHLGTGPAVDGDSIYNGAYDNASGVSLLLEVADAFSRLEPRPARSILFMATTAEEAGLLGSRHYTQHPLLPLEATVAALNVDGANLWGETDDVVAIGADRSTIGALVAARAAEAGLSLAPDPMPELGVFFRSDHFAFARAGIPVLHLRHGIRFRGRTAEWGEELMARYDATRYHRPGDEYEPAFDLEGAVQQGRLLFSVAYDIATWDRRPEWRAGQEVAARGAGPGR